LAVAAAACGFVSLGGWAPEQHGRAAFTGVAYAADASVDERKDSQIVDEIHGDASRAETAAEAAGTADPLALQALLKRAAGIGSPSLRGQAYGHIASVQLALGDFKDALATAGRIPSEPLRASATVFIEEVQTLEEARKASGSKQVRQKLLKEETGDIGPALETSGRIADSLVQSYLLSGAAAQRIKVEAGRGALKLAKAIPDVPIRTRTLARIAKLGSLQKDLTLALEAARDVPNPSTRDELLLELVAMRLAQKDQVGAGTFAAAIADPQKASWAEAQIASRTQPPSNPIAP
jgi:hypothetical protein